MNMDEKIFLSTLLYKSIVDKTENSRQLSYKVLGPMLGTVEDYIFINTHDRRYTSIEMNNTNVSDNIRYAYYNLISVKDAKEKYQLDNLDEIVKKFKEEYEKDSYYVMVSNDSEPLIIKYDQDKLKRKYESDVARPI